MARSRSAGVAASLVVAAGMLGGSAEAMQLRSTYCPVGAAARGTHLDGALAAARRLSLTRSQRANATVAAIVELAPRPEALSIPGGRELHSRAQLRCGRAVADASWAVVFNLPDTKVASSAQKTVFVVMVAGRWALYF